MHGSCHHHGAKQKQAERSRPPHFQEGSILDHLFHRRSQQLISIAEGHSLEAPDWISTAINAIRDTAALYLIWGTLFNLIKLPYFLWVSITFMLGWGCWRIGQTAWRSWNKLERLHHLLEDEHREIEQNRDQEKLELRELYAAKGLTGNLLDEVIDVLMADDNRALKVMMQEEMGLILEAYDHPLKQAFGAFIGIFIAAFLCTLIYMNLNFIGLCVIATFLISAMAGLTAYYAQNPLVPAVMWNLGLCSLSVGVPYFIIKALQLWKYLPR